MFGKTALGIDISNGRISMALLRKGKKGLRLLKAAGAAIPEGAVQEGNIQNAAALAKAIKKLKARNRIHEHYSVLSLVADPVLMQILDLPRSVPTNISQYVREEVKHYVVLPRQKTAVDFCGINSSVRSAGHRLLVVATDSEKIENMGRVLNQAALRSTIRAIEPPVLAYIRACYEKKIAGQFDRNLLFVMVHEGITSFCLFRNQTLDFVRVKRPDAETCHRCTLTSAQCSRCLADEINAIVQFYDIQAAEEMVRWEVSLVTDEPADSVPAKAELLQGKLKAVDFEAMPLENAFIDTPVGNTQHTVKPSAIAVGLAMKFLDFPTYDLNVNLIPSEVVESKSARKQALMIAASGVLVFVLMIFAMLILDIRGKMQHTTLQEQKQSQLRRNNQMLKNEEKLLKSHLSTVSQDLHNINKALASGSFIKWGVILQDISLATPKVVRITSLTTDDNMNVLLTGQALSYQAVDLFARKLNESEHINSASLLGAQKDSGSSYVVSYTINCSLVQ